MRLIGILLSALVASFLAGYCSFKCCGLPKGFLVNRPLSRGYAAPLASARALHHLARGTRCGTAALAQAGTLFRRNRTAIASLSASFLARATRSLALQPSRRSSSAKTRSALACAVSRRVLLSINERIAYRLRTRPADSPMLPIRRRIDRAALFIPRLTRRERPMRGAAAGTPLRRPPAFPPPGH